MKKFVTGIFTAAALFGASAPLLGDEPSLFERLDKNKDGQLTADEVSEEHKALFERLLRNADKNSDSKLSKEEFAAGQTKKEEPRSTFGSGSGGPGPGMMRPGEMLSRLDKDKDGKLSKEEVPERMRENFSKMDQNGDGFVEPKELEAAMRTMMQRGGGGAGGPPNPQMLERMFADRDANKDGKISASEIPEERRENFVRMVKAAGKDPEAGVTKEEMTEFFNKMKNRRSDQEAGEELAQEERRREEQSKRDGERRPDGDRKPEGDRRPEERRPEARGGEGRDRRPDAPREGRPDGDRRPDERRSEGERRPEGNRGPDGNRPDERRPDGEGRPNRTQFPPVFAALDADHNGRVSADELETAGRHLKALDRNGDGALTPDELFGIPGRGPQPMGDRRPDGDRPAPRDGEGRGPRPDGARGENPRPEGERREGRPDGERRPGGEGRPEGDRPAPRDGEGRGPRPDGARGENPRPEGGPGPEEFLRRLKEADADHNGKISREEAPERLKANFERLDTNGDGQLDEQEVRAMLGRMSGRGEGRRPDGEGRRPGGEGRPDGERGPRPDRESN